MNLHSLGLGPLHGGAVLSRCTWPQKRERGKAVHGADLALGPLPGLIPTTCGEQNVFSDLWCWPNSWPISRCSFYAL